MCAEPLDEQLPCISIKRTKTQTTQVPTVSRPRRSFNSRSCARRIVARTFPQPRSTHAATSERLLFKRSVSTKLYASRSKRFDRRFQKIALRQPVRYKVCVSQPTCLQPLKALQELLWGAHDVRVGRVRNHHHLLLVQSLHGQLQAPLCLLRTAGRAAPHRVKLPSLRQQLP